jgi:putative redox protein
MKVDIQWKGNMQFVSSFPSGHTLLLDTAPEHGGENLGPRPVEILLSAVGTCSAIDVVDILRKMRLDLQEFSVEVTGKRQEEHPRKFTKVHIHYSLTGDLPKEKVERAIQLSIEKYCSVAHSLSAEISTSYSIRSNQN